MRRAILAMVLLAVAVPAFAHEVRPAYLELHEERAGEYLLLWKIPMRGEMRLSLSPEFSGRTESLTPVMSRHTGDAAVQTWRIRAVDPLRGQTVRVRGLEGTMTDALVRIVFADGTSWVHRLTPQSPASSIPRETSRLMVAGVYSKLGVEHILSGVDHLVFVLALLIITNGAWRLFKTVTAFTAAHSITLALATLGLVHVPQRPVEAVIALSIVFVAMEIVHLRAGRESMTSRSPWVVAFAFGLLHGFGFAGALSEVGLPQSHIPLALLFFNVGVEVGQLLFIAAALGLVGLWRRSGISFPRWAELVPPYAIGSIAMFWVIQRVAAF